MILSLSLSGSLIIVILFLFKPVYRERLSKRWQYYIWLVVIARLLLPFSFEINLVGSLFEEINQIAVLWESNAIITEIQTIVLYPQVDMPETSAGLPLQYFWVVWLAVAIVLFVRKITILKLKYP